MSEVYELRILYVLHRNGIKTSDPELGKRVLDVLRRLNSLANGPTTAYAVDPISSGKSEANPPRDFDSPYVEYLERFRGASNDRALAKHVTKAEVECSIFRGEDPNARVRAALRVGDEPEAEDDAMERVVRWYRGETPEEAAEGEGNPFLADWIRKARRVNRCDEETGESLPEWHGWSDKQRLKEVNDRKRKGMTPTQIAEDLQVSRGAIHHLKSRTERRAA